MRVPESYRFYKSDNLIFSIPDPSLNSMRARDNEK